MNLVYNVCSIVTMPVEMALRPQYGSRYFPPVITFFSAAMMIVLPVFSRAGGGLLPHDSLRPLSGAVGLFGIGTLSKLYLPGQHRPWLPHLAAHDPHGARGEQRL